MSSLQLLHPARVAADLNEVSLAILEGVWEHQAQSGRGFSRGDFLKDDGVQSPPVLTGILDYHVVIHIYAHDGTHSTHRLEREEEDRLNIWNSFI